MSSTFSRSTTPPGCELCWSGRDAALPDAERADLIDVLQDSLQGANDDLSPEWTTEITRRITAVSRGESQVIPGDEVDARIRQALDRA